MFALLATENVDSPIILPLGDRAILLTVYYHKSILEFEIKERSHFLRGKVWLKCEAVKLKGS